MKNIRIVINRPVIARIARIVIRIIVMRLAIII